MSRATELAQIHIAKKDLGLDDDTYRAMLWTVAQVKSSSELDVNGRTAVLKHLKAHGWKPLHNKPDVAKIKQGLIAKMSALLTDMQLPWAYAEKLALRMYKRQKIEWCKPTELRGMIAALVKKQRKLKTDAENARDEG